MIEYMEHAGTGDPRLSIAESIRRSTVGLESIKPMDTRNILPEDPWQMRLIAGGLTTPYVEVTTDGQRVFVESRPTDSTFSYLEIINPTDIYYSPTKINYYESIPQNLTIINSSAREEEIISPKGQPKPLWSFSSSVYLLNPNTGQAVDLIELGKVLSGLDDVKYHFAHQLSKEYKGAESAAIGRVAGGVILTGAVPASFSDLIEVMHEEGHLVGTDYSKAATLTRLRVARTLAREDRKFLGDLSAVVDNTDEGFIGARGENMYLKTDVENERDAWAASILMMKALQRGGYIQIDNSTLMNKAESALQTYDDGSKVIKGRTTVDTFYTKEMRKILRTKNPVRRLAMRMRLAVKNI